MSSKDTSIRVQDNMTKLSDVLLVPYYATVEEVAQQLQERGQRAALVRLDGSTTRTIHINSIVIITDKDLMRANADDPVGEIGYKPISISYAELMSIAKNKMETANIHQLVVVDKEYKEVHGMVSAIQAAAALTKRR